MDYDLIIVRYGEIGVKSPKVRRRFENKLISNIKSKINCRVKINQGRIFLYPQDFEDAEAKLNKVMGIVSYSPAICIKTDCNDITDNLNNYVDALLSEGLFDSDKSFAVRCRRVGKHEFSSHEMAGFCGSVIVGKTGAPVNLSNPEFKFYVEVRDNKTYLYHQKIPGPGGLPVGTQGKVVTLLSGGIDSPVSSFLMMKRGCELVVLHFNNHPYTDGSNNKLMKIIKKLEEYSPSKLKVYIAPYGSYLKSCIEKAPHRLTCVLCKTGMYRIAQEIAKKEDALAIVDGSSLGQVASQTLPNLLATRYVTNMPVLSPLIGLDKVEIGDMGKKIGTFEISILPAPGCTAVPQYPETNAKLEKFLDVLREIDFEDEVKNVLSSIKKE